MRKSFKKVLSLALTAAMAVSLGSGFVAPTTAEAATLAANKVKDYTNAPYNAYLCFQSSLYSYRDAFDNDTAGITNTSIPRTSSTKIYQNDEKANLDSASKTANAGVDVFYWDKMFIQNAPFGTETKKGDDTTFRDFNADGTLDQYTVPKNCKWIVRTADFQQPDITYDGTYTVSMSNFAEDTFKYNYGFRMLYINTNIPLSVKNVKFSDITLKIDGVQVGETMKEGVIRNATDSPNTYNVMVTNEYGYISYGCKGEAPVESKKDAAPDPVWEAAKKAGTESVMPKKSIEITFTVSGLGTAPAGYVPQDKNVSAASTQAIVAEALAKIEAAKNQTNPDGSTNTSGSAVKSLAVGEKFTAGNFNYKVIKASETNDGSAEVAVAGLTKSAKKKASLTVSKTVENASISYKITTIGKKAFANNKKLKSVTLGANVKKIEKQAFSKCTKLAKLNVKGKLTKVDKKAFAGCKKKIKVLGSKKKANIKVLKKSGYKKFK